MRLFGLEIPARKGHTDGDLDAILRRLHAFYELASGVTVTPETCMQSPTVHAIVTAVSRRIAASPIRVMQRSESNGRERKESLPSHPVTRLLRTPNEWQTKSDYWLDAVSSFLRYGRFIAYKGRGSTGPIRRLIPLHASCVDVRQDDDYSVRFCVTDIGGSYHEYTPDEVHYVRGPARDFLRGDSPIADIREAIGLEIAAEKFGASFFGNGASPFLVFKYMQGVAPFKKEEDAKRFVDDFQAAYTGRRRFRGMLLPKGLELDDPVTLQNDKAQFLETRKYQRTVIAGALGVPPHFVGDLERATFNNVEQQDTDFISNVIQPIAQAFEAAMERDLLTAADRAAGVVIRFNLDAVQRADFKSRQEGLRVQREMGVISPNDWRERENLNPISEDDGGEDYLRPSNMVVAGEEPEPAVKPQGSASDVEPTRVQNRQP